MENTQDLQNPFLKVEVDLLNDTGEKSSRYYLTISLN